MPIARFAAVGNDTGLQIQFRPQRHDAGRIDAAVAGVIVVLDVEEVDRLRDARPVVELLADSGSAPDSP